MTPNKHIRCYTVKLPGERDAGDLEKVLGTLGRRSSSKLPKGGELWQTGLLPLAERAALFCCGGIILAEMAVWVWFDFVSVSSINSKHFSPHQNTKLVFFCFVGVFMLKRLYKEY